MKKLLLFVVIFTVKNVVAQQQAPQVIYVNVGQQCCQNTCPPAGNKVPVAAEPVLVESINPFGLPEEVKMQASNFYELNQLPEGYIGPMGTGLILYCPFSYDHLGAATNPSTNDLTVWVRINGELRAIMPDITSPPASWEGRFCRGGKWQKDKDGSMHYLISGLYTVSIQQTFARGGVPKFTARFSSF